MDGIAAIEHRIAAIQGTLATLRGPAVTGSPVAGAASSATAVRPASATQFAAVLASEVAGTASGPPAAGRSVAGYTDDQVRNARAVVGAGQRMGLSLRDQAIGVMTAMGESSLRVLDHGDLAGPDSRGLFQQRDNGAWGTLAQRMDPTASATGFFTALARVGGRAAMSPTLVAHTVQRNADPQHYARYWDDAVALVGQITGAPAGQITGR